MIRSQVQLTPEQSKGLKALATERGISVAQAIRDAVDAQLAGRPAPRSRREKAVAAIGGYHSSKADVSADHDRYLAEAYRE